MLGERRRVTRERRRVARDVHDDRRAGVRDLRAHLRLRARARRVEDDDVGVRALRIDVFLERLEHVAAQRLHRVDARALEVPAGVRDRRLRTFDADELRMLVDQGRERQREQAGSRIQVPDHQIAAVAGRAVAKDFADLVDDILRQHLRCLAVHLPEAGGVHRVVEGVSVHGDPLGQAAAAVAHLAVDDDGVVPADGTAQRSPIRDVRGVHARLGNGDAHLRVGG